MLIACISERAKRLEVPADLPVLRETLAQVLAVFIAIPPVFMGECELNGFADPDNEAKQIVADAVYKKVRERLTA